ncbi:two-component system response regulator CreB [Labrys okinawensis]|uniref:Two-component system response regulator CreB n=1 Tax=Labrys okinawensis TaxID=346911 RepID=A0A2S9Q966_9HYPH|nr:response regulator transcription factor [Labrys okinawensis]PRH85891.1 two-component system response regulator CreB [Labrys okinawensis]
MSRTILIVDDDPHIRELLAFALAKAGMATHQAGDGEEGLAKALSLKPDLAILDINMPRMDGLEVCRRLRAQSELPVLFLSSRDDEIDRVLGLEMGADDYVVKPFSPREVVARVGAILKRVGARPAQSAPASVLERGLLHLDPEGWQTQWAGESVGLTAKEFQLLQILAATPSKVFSRDEIIDRLHGPGFAITDRTIDSHIRHIRQKFAVVGAEDVIETRAGIGYRIGACAGKAA